MRGVVSTSAVVLFIAFAAAVAILAVLVDMYAQWVLEEDVGLLASSVADFIASQVRDLLAGASLPGVYMINQTVFIPRTFFGFDSAGVSICVKNEGGFLYVNVTAVGQRGRGEAWATAVAWTYNVTKWAVEHRKGLYLAGRFVPYDCRGGQPLPGGCVAGGLLDLTKSGCSALLVDVSLCANSTGFRC